MIDVIHTLKTSKKKSLKSATGTWKASACTSATRRISSPTRPIRRTPHPPSLARYLSSLSSSAPATAPTSSFVGRQASRPLLARRVFLALPWQTVLRGGGLRLVLERAAAVILPLEGRGDWEVEEGRCWGRSGGDARSRSTAMVAAAGGVPVMGFGLWLYFRRLWLYFPVCVDCGP